MTDHPTLSTYLICSARAWNRELPARLSQRTGHRFELIDRPDELTRERLQELAPAAVFFPHWSWIVPPSIHNAFDCVMFHMTDLPYGRGGSPLQNLIVRGHEDTVMTAFRCSGEMDGGPILLKRPLNLNGSAEEILIRAGALMEEMIIEIIEQCPEPVPQEGEAVSFRRRSPADGDISRLDELVRVFDHIRMLDAQGYPPAFVDIGALRLEFSRASRKRDAVLADVKITLQTDPKKSTTS